MTHTTIAYAVDVIEGATLASFTCHLRCSCGVSQTTVAGTHQRAWERAMTAQHEHEARMVSSVIDRASLL
jgi:hypothetical protein